MILLMQPQLNPNSTNCAVSWLSLLRMDVFNVAPVAGHKKLWFNPPQE